MPLIISSPISRPLSPSQENMFILAGKLLLLFVFFIYLINTTILAQPVFNYFDCVEAVNFTGNGRYERNLDANLAALPATNSGFGFFNLSVGQGTDRVNSFALCRGDLAPDICRSCLNDSIGKLRERCPNEKEAIGYYDYCMLKYSNEILLGHAQIKFYENLLNNETVSDDQVGFDRAVRQLMNRLSRDAAAGGSLLKFATGNTTGPDVQTIYGLVQCSPDLIEQECSDCLEDAMTQFWNLYSGRIGGRALAPKCNFRYEIDRFYNRSTFVIPPPTLQPSRPPGKKTKTTRTSIIVIVVVTFSIIIIIAAICSFMRWRRKKQEIKTIDMGTTEFSQYDFSIVRAATNDFSEDNKLGKGGFGAVYKGKLKEGQQIAVKRLERNSNQGDPEFKNEVSLLAKLQHRNLVRLLGFSLQGRERLLIYEYLPNGSLDKFIFDPTKRALLDRENRYNIIEGIAKGLQYIHEDSHQKIVHRDLKADNILLDAQMNPKIADFGMARLFKLEETQGDTSRIVGTLGYMAPEVFHRKVSVKSDVFSFGVLVLEMVAGQSISSFRIGGNTEYLTTFAWKGWQKKTILDMIDPTLMTGLGSLHDDIIKCIHIGLLCVQENVDDRPTMNSVVHMLHNSSPSLSMPKMPGHYMYSSSDPETPLFQDYPSSA